MSPAPRPLLAERDLAAPLAWRAGRAISGHAFLAAAARLAERLPAAGRAINLCQDRLHFALGLAAALQRGQASLMPPNALPATLRQLPADGPAPYVLADADSDDLDVGGLPVVRVHFDDAAANAADATTPMPQVDAYATAVVLLTSGSTGAPQPHGKRFGPLGLNIAAEAARLAEWLGQPTLHGLAIVATVPPQHSYGLESSVLLALLGGATMDSGRPFYPADIAAALAAVPRPRMLVTTPFHLKALVQSGVPLPAVDLVLSATAPLSPQLAAQAEAAMGARLGEIYGCTEAGQVAARLTTQGETWTTLGELRLTREEIPGQGGEPAAERFIVQGGHVVEPTPLADVLVLESDRRFRLLGRANDLIHVAGKRSSLAHLNFHLNRIEGVEDGAFWLPEPGDLPSQPGEVEAVHRPIAFVVAPRLTTRQVIAALRAELEPAFVPRRVVHVPALPREGTGKLTVSALRAFAIVTLGTSGAPGAQGASGECGESASRRAAPAGAAAPNTAASNAASSKTDAPPAGASETEFDIAPDHPAFAGHFPGHPLLPGVALLSLVMRALRRQPGVAGMGDGTGPGEQDAAGPADERSAPGWTDELPPLAIEQVKFLAPVGPGERVRVRLTPSPTRRGALAFECFVADSAPRASGGDGPGGTGDAAATMAATSVGSRVVARGVLGPMAVPADGAREGRGSAKEPTP